MDINEAIELVREELEKRRYDHTIRVMETAEALAERYGVPIDKVKLAAVLHDYAKNWPVEKLKQYVIDYELPEELLAFDSELWHGPVAAHLLEKEGLVHDLEVLGAIRHHTTGKQGMNDVEMIIYLADYIEPGRNFPGLEEVREISEKDLNYACWLVARNTVRFLLDKHALIYPDSLDAYNDLTRKIKMEGLLDG